MWLPSLPLPNPDDPAQVQLNNELRRVPPVVVGWNVLLYGHGIDFHVQVSSDEYPYVFFVETTKDVPTGLDRMAEMGFNVADARARWVRILAEPDGVSWRSRSTRLTPCWTG